MSSDLIWLLTRENTAFMVKRNGIQLSREPGNLLNKNSLKCSGLTNKAVAITAGEKGVVITLKTSKGKRSIALKGNVRQSAKQTKNIVSKYRPDLVSHALARVSRIIASQQPAKALKPKKLRGKKALAASA